MSDTVKYAASEFAFAACMICIGCFIGGIVNYAMRDDPKPPAVATPVPAPVAVPTLPETTPPFAVFDYEDMAGLDAETQAMLAETQVMLAENERSGRDNDRRLRAIEANLDALNHRVFGPSVRVRGGIGETGEMGDVSADAN